MNFLVTGGAGFIGSHVCERLLEFGHAVWALDDLNDFYDPNIKCQSLEEIKVTIASLTSVYGVNAKVQLSEDDPIFSPISPYAASKLACEALGHVYHHVYGMDVAMLRFFTVYGPRQRPDLAIHKFSRLIY